MTPSNKIRQFIMNHEGCTLVAIRPLPTDRWTYGYGSTFKADGTAVDMGDTITLPEAVNLFNSKLDVLAYGLSHITNSKCTQQQFDAVLSLAYNVGLQALENSTTGTMFSNGQDISDRFQMWDKSNGQVVQGLLNRRLAEQQIYDNANYGT